MTIFERLGDWWGGLRIPRLPRRTTGDSEVSAPSDAGAVARPRRRRAKWLALGILALLLLYYPVGMVWINRIDDDTSFTAPAIKDGESRAVAITAALIHREVDVNRWTANDPFFLPAAALDNMPNFQQGIIAALSRFVIEMVDHIGRTRGSSQADPDLVVAAGLLKYPGTVWVFDPSVSWMPTASSERQYRSARRHLLAYNVRLGAGKAVFERRADNLLTTLGRFAADLGSSSATLAQRVQKDSGRFIDFQADDIFYNVKGRLYAYYLLIRALGVDYSKVIAEKEIGPSWRQLLDSLKAAAQLDPWVVVNGAPDSQFRPSHLASQGFYLLRARTQLKEITNILLK